MKVPGFDCTELFSTVAAETSTIIMIGLALFHKEEIWITDLCDVKAAFINTNMPVEMLIECPESIVDLGIITKEFGNVDAALLWLILLAKYLIKK